MIQSVYQTGLRVQTTTPQSGFLGASIYTLIELIFNSDLNTGSIENNIAVFEDENGKYVNIDSIRNNPSLFPAIKGTYTYRDRVVTFTPDSPLKNSVKYIVAVKMDGIKDIYGNATVQEQTFHFITESNDIEPRVDITSPSAGAVLPFLKEIRWSNVSSEAYFIEVSNQQTFETTVYAGMVKRDHVTGKTPNLFSEEVLLENGLYYIRVKALKGLWSEPVQIFIKKVTEAVTSEEDLKDIIHQLSIDEYPLELLESFPDGNNANHPLNLAMCYFKFRGFIDFSEVDLYESMVEMASIEGNAEIPVEVPGIWDHVYDEREDVTYLIYQIEK